MSLESDTPASEASGRGGLILGEVAVRVAILVGLATAVVAAVRPEAVIVLALVYPVGLAFRGATGGSIDGRRTRPRLATAILVSAGAFFAVWLRDHAPAGLLMAWAGAMGVVTASLLARLLAPIDPPDSEAPSR